MSNTVQGVPTPADFPATAGNFDSRVTRNANGSINYPPGWKVRHQFPISAQNPSAARFEWDAMLSAHEMIYEHDQRILDAGQIPDSDQYKRLMLWWSYYNLSVLQFSNDETRLSAGKSPQILYSADGIAPYPPQRLSDIRLEEAMGRIKTADQRALDEILRVYGPGRTAAEISEKLATNPYSALWVQMYIESQLGPEDVFNPASPSPTTDVTGTAPNPSLGALNRCIPRDPSLPATLSNCLTQSEMYELLAREAGFIVQQAPEYWRDAEAKEAKEDFELRAYYYWKENYPTVLLKAEQNPGLGPNQLTVPWDGPGLPPLVLVEITPRQRPLPEKNWLLDNPWLGLVVSAIPLVGGIFSAGLDYERNSELKKWAGAWKPNNSQFAPQFYPKPFLVPMPLDRAQIMVKQPWYAVAMVDQFAEEVRLNNLRFASDQYAALVDAMNNQPTSASALPVGQGAAIQSLDPSSNQAKQAGSASALPFLLAGVLLVAGAPVAVPIVIVLLASKK